MVAEHQLRPTNTTTLHLDSDDHNLTTTRLPRNTRKCDFENLKEPVMKELKNGPLDNKPDKTANTWPQEFNLVEAMQFEEHIQQTVKLEMSIDHDNEELNDDDLPRLNGTCRERGDEVPTL